LAGFVVGVGSAPDTNSPERDSQKARTKALAALAEQLEVRISSQTTSVEQSTGRGSATSFFQQALAASTELTVEGLELVETFRSRRDGYWYYYRLSLAAWERLRNPELTAFQDRLQDQFRQLDAQQSLASWLDQARLTQDLIKKSPFKGQAAVRVAERSIVADDFLRERVGQKLQELTFQLTPSTSSIPADQSVLVQVRAKTANGTAPGSLDFWALDSAGKTIAPGKTESDGLGTVRLLGTKLGTGHSIVTIGMMPIRGLEEFDVRNLPSSQTEVQVNSVELGFLVDTGTPQERAAISASLRPALLNSAPVTITEGNLNLKYTLVASASFRDMPDNGFGIVVTWCTLRYDFRTDGRTVSSYVSVETKGAGLDLALAHSAALKGILAALRDDTNFVKSTSSFLGNAN
jgi:hypothetical protein